MSKVGHVAYQAMRLREENRLEPSQVLYLDSVKSINKEFDLR